jgi:glycerophosphoryl diester phosphodiesterase
MVHHDAVVPGVGDLVAFSFAQLRRAAPHVPTLDEAIDACAGMFVNAEIKNSPLDPDWDPDDQVAVAVARRIARHGLYDRVLVSSFNPGTLAAVRRIDTDIATGWLLPRRVPASPAISAAASSGHRALHPHASSLRGKAAERVATRAAEAGLWTIAWTVDEADEIRRLSAAGVTGIITNDPDMAVKALGRIPSP